jgi:spore coat polysaccharide biosynthesis protein SpsF
MKKIGIIIQARMESSRLPNKVLMDIDGKPLLEFIIKRLKRLENIEIIVATTNQKADNKITELCTPINIPYYRGSTENVLERYIECAQKFNIDIIIRVCSDSPFIDQEGILNLLDTYKKNPTADLIHNKHKYGYPFGTGAELVTLKALEIAQKYATEKYQKEHVLPYILENPNKFKIIQVNAPPKLIRPGYFLTIDYPEDLDLIKKIIEIISFKEKEYIPLELIIILLDTNQDLVKINNHLHEGYRV